MTGVTLYYAIISILSFILLLIYVFRWQKRFETHMSVIFVLIPIVNLAYYMMYANMNSNTAIIGLKTLYLGGCYLPWLSTMCIASLCKININRVIKMISFLVTTVMFGFILSIGHSGLFYKSYSFAQNGENWIMQREYGPMHTVYYVIIALYLIIDLSLIIHTYIKKHQVSRLVLFLLFMPIPISMFGYVINHFTSHSGVEIVPVTYLLAQIVYLFIVQRMVIYNVSDMAVETMVESGNTGFVTMDFKKRYLGSNKIARSILPDLNNLTVDGAVDKTEKLKDTLLKRVDDFKDNNKIDNIFYKCNINGEEDERIYRVTVNYLYDGRRKRGYQIFFDDDTQDQKYISLIDNYNYKLQEEVAIKTNRIVEMHNKLILGMATMVESRDNSTGGHIRRTSEGVRILIDEMKKDKSLNLSEEFCKNIIKAAPMHDLGKIAVDDAILRKQGIFTEEEREKMKMHSSEGARIVHAILKDTDDEEFRKIAENVAHYHHERMDGNGYPNKLKGDQIPLEARIMAIADVYDALVSKRVYKEKFSFEVADKIILDGMGTQFDARLQKYYEAARPKLEKYYLEEQKND